ncbi:MAG: InlB B-repeat-containing protein [Clostridia bacterium]|nr:InlB B-repeat-containing protein [Clostridia bacterium]
MKRLISVILTLTMLLSLFSVVPVQAASSSYRDWKQYSGYWKSYKLGGSSYTMKSIGCTTTALAMAAVKLGCESENSFDPGIFLTRMNNASGYNGYGAIYWSKINKAVPNMSIVGSEIKFSTESNSTRIAKISENLNKGYAVLITILRYTDTDGDKHWHYVLADSVNNGVLNILDPGGANGNITNKYGSAEIMIRSIRMFKNNGKTKHETEVVIPPQTHTCSYSVSTESAHPHNKYNVCSCGKKVYLGKNTVSSCSSCYPVGNVNLTRSFEKTKGTATFYRNNVNNATSYTLKLYHNDNLYNTYNMSSDEYYVSGLPSGEYYAVLYAKNTATGEERSDSCPGFKISDSYTVSYNAKGGSNAPSSQTKIEDTNLTLTSSVPTKPHYVFKGWARSKNATVAEYQPGDTYNRNAKVTLYAVWEPETYTVKFDANGGKGEILEKTITYGDAIRIPNNIVKDGYYLKGWSTSETATTATHRIGMDYKFDANTTLYAVWGESTWSGDVASSFAGGDGTAENPYQISNASELALLAKKVNSQTQSPNKEYYVLTNNIDLNYENWVPIGVYENQYQVFYGCLDGKGYTISGLYISGGDYNYYGLFGMLSGDLGKGIYIKNLTIKGDIESINNSESIYIGGLAGAYKLYNVNIENVNATYIDISNVRVSGNSILCIGGIIGGAPGFQLSANLVNCSVNNTTISFELVNSTGCAGGIVGYGQYCRLKNCVLNDENGVFGNIEVDINSQLFIGGISGQSNEISNCYVKSGRFMDKIDVEGYVCAGGITGKGNVENSSVNFTNKETILYAGEQIPYSIYICAKGGRVGGFTTSGNVKNSRFNGCSLLLTSKGDNSVPMHSMIAGITPSGLEIENVVCNIDGIIHVKAQDSYVYAGGFMAVPEINYVDRDKSVKSSMVIADKIYVENHSNSYGTETIAGDVTAMIDVSTFDIDKAYVNDDLILEVSALKTQNSICQTSENAILKSITKLKTKSFQKNLLKLNEYRSMEALSLDNSAVWILKEGEIPEYYYNCLNDITISNDIVNGSVSIDKKQAVDGEIVTVTATPNTGYVLNKVYVDGAEQDGTTFVVDGNDEVYVTFAEEIAEYNVTISANDNATGSLVNMDSAEPMLMSVRLMSNEADSSITANDGEEILVNAVADSDYTVDSIYVNGEEVAGNSFILTEDSVVTMDVTNISTDIVATTNDAEDVGSYFAVVSGSVLGEDENAVKYIRYWSADDTEIVYTTEVETGTGDYSVELMDLEPETTYYYQMTEFGEVKSFTTEEEIIPILDESEIDEDDGDSASSPSPITTTTYKTLTSTYKFSIECSQALTTEFLAIACYDNMGKLLAFKQIECDGDTSYVDSVPLDTNIDYAKIFVWSSVNSLKPLAGVEVVDISE